VRATSGALAIALAVVLGGCGSGETGGGECVSGYELLASAESWPDLEAALLDTDQWGDVASVRTQAKGIDVGIGDEEAVRVIDLLDAKGRRLVQGEVWRTDDGGWAAGVWSQCLD